MLGIVAGFCLVVFLLNPILAVCIAGVLVIVGICMESPIYIPLVIFGLLALNYIENSTKK